MSTAMSEDFTEKNWRHFCWLGMEEDFSQIEDTISIGMEDDNQWLIL